VPDKGAYLRVVPTKNGQTRGVRWAKDYVIWSASAGKACASANPGHAEGDDGLKGGLRVVGGAP
jgi:hypothetical protein